MAGSSTPRARARARTLDEITEIARRQIAEQGAATLSLRGVARELGVVSSAVYRYYPSRDALITALLIDSFGRLGDAVEQAAGRRAATPRARFVAACAALRDWARDHPHEFMLIYGSPIPGYAAPADTVPAAARVVTPFVEVLVAAGDALGAAEEVPGPAALVRQLGGIADRLGAPELAPATVAALFSVLSELIGFTSLELNGHLVGTIDPADRYSRLAFDRLADRVGLGAD
ncbi:TetR/AcrR family transcriptional regulator [Naumannella huperziae]